MTTNTKYQQANWFIALENACTNQSQASVAAQCGFSATALNQVLKNSYKGSINNIQEKVEGALLNHQVNCPVLDNITTDLCARYRREGFLPTNPMRVQLYSACQHCQHNPKGVS